jgi:hypothetical protein
MHTSMGDGLPFAEVASAGPTLGGGEDDGLEQPTNETSVTAIGLGRGISPM